MGEGIWITKGILQGNEALVKIGPAPPLSRNRVAAVSSQHQQPIGRGLRSLILAAQSVHHGIIITHKVQDITGDV